MKYLVLIFLAAFGCGPKEKTPGKPVPAQAVQATPTVVVPVPTPAAAPAAKAVPAPDKGSLQDATHYEVVSVSTAASLDRARFPLLIRADDQRQLSPDRSLRLWRAGQPGSFFLALSKARKNIRNENQPDLLPHSDHAYYPHWSRDGRRILYTAIDWNLGERAITVYDLATRTSRKVFKAAQGLGGLAAWSPDGSKIVFTYSGRLWIMNADGVGLKFLNLGRPLPSVSTFAWSVKGDSLACLPVGGRKYFIVKLTHRH